MASRISSWQNCFVLAWLFFIAACAAMPTTPSTPEETGNAIQIVLIEQRLVILADQATLRAGPGVSFDNVGSLKQGTAVEGTGQTLDGDWYRIRNPEGGVEEAWVSAEFVGPELPVAEDGSSESGIVDSPSSWTTVIAGITNTPFRALTNTASILPTQPLTPTPGALLISATVATNCRAGTSKVFDIIAILMPGDQVEVRGRSLDGLWWYIQDPGRPSRSCWVWGETTMVSGDASQVPVVKPPPTPTSALVMPATPTRAFTLLPMPTIVFPTPTPTATATSTFTLQPVDTPEPSPTTTPPATLAPIEEPTITLTSLVTEPPPLP